MYLNLMLHVVKIPVSVLVYICTYACRYLAKILVPEGAKDIPVGQPIAITVTCHGVLDHSLFSVHYVV